MKSRENTIDSGQRVQIDSGSFFQGHMTMIRLAEAAGWTQVDEFIHVRGRGPQSQTSQIHSRRVHSFLCIFEK